MKAGILNAKTHVSKVRLLDKAAPVKKKPGEKPAQRGKSTVHIAFKPELDVRGNNGADAWILVDKYLDDAMLAGIEKVRIIHGKGTGALRTALWEDFRRDPRIASFRTGAYGEGDAGVTIVELK